MTDKAPERIWVDTFSKGERGPIWPKKPVWAATEYVPATALEAAQARITGLEAEVSAWRQVRDAVAELEGLGPDWPSHGNAPLAVTSGYALHRQRAATARAEALEEADTNVWALFPKKDPEKWSLEDKGFAEGICDAVETIRALKEKPNG